MTVCSKTYPSFCLNFLPSIWFALKRANCTKWNNLENIDICVYGHSTRFIYLAGIPVKMIYVTVI